MAYATPARRPAIRRDRRRPRSPKTPPRRPSTCTSRRGTRPHRTCGTMRTCRTPPGCGPSPRRRVVRGPGPGLSSARHGPRSAPRRACNSPLPGSSTMLIRSFEAETDSEDRKTMFIHVLFPPTFSDLKSGPDRPPLRMPSATGRPDRIRSIALKIFVARAVLLLNGLTLSRCWLSNAVAEVVRLRTRSGAAVAIGLKSHDFSYVLVLDLKQANNHRQY